MACLSVAVESTSDGCRPVLPCGDADTGDSSVMAPLGYGVVSAGEDDADG